MKQKLLILKNRRLNYIVRPNGGKRLLVRVIGGLKKFEGARLRESIVRVSLLLVTLAKSDS